MERIDLERWLDALRENRSNSVIEKSAIIANFYQMCSKVDAGSDPVFVAKRLLETSVGERYCRICNQDLYIAFCAFVRFHLRGVNFQYRWNAEAKICKNYSDYIHSTASRYLTQVPFCRSRPSDGKK